MTDDPLGFNEERMRRGEAEVAAGKFRPLADVLAEIRRRHLDSGDGPGNETTIPSRDG